MLGVGHWAACVMAWGVLRWGQAWGVCADVWSSAPGVVQSVGQCTKCGGVWCRASGVSGVQGVIKCGALQGGAEREAPRVDAKSTHSHLQNTREERRGAAAPQTHTHTHTHRDRPRV